MTRIKFLLAVLAVAAMVAVTPTANAQTAHVVGVGSSAQFLGTVTAMDALAQANVTTGNCVYHWTAKGDLEAHDNRDSLNRILDEAASGVGIVWIAALDSGDVCPGGSGTVSSGNNGVTDVWLVAEYDSTLGVRLFSAQQVATTCNGVAATSCPGATVYFPSLTFPVASTGLVNTGLWPDDAADVPLPSAFETYVGNAAPGNLNVNMALTDIRPEDALYATTRAKTALSTTTYAGLGYVGPTSQIGAPIYENSTLGSHTYTPIGFALSGGKDPINTKATVPPYTTIPVGAAPIVFAYNNAGAYSASVSNLTTGVNGEGTAGTAGKYYLANLFDGTTDCDTNNKTFGGSGVAGGTTINLILREPLSGTMNTTEFSLFRTTGNTDDSQEKGIINPTRSPYNPLGLACTGGGGSRLRAIGTGDVLAGINKNANYLGYFFFSFANSNSVIGTNPQANYNYFLVDGVDPIGLPTTNQELPECAGPCPANQWTGSISFPNLRNGTYKAWSLYRWTVYTSDTDSLGPIGLAAEIQNQIDATNSNADFVPFSNSSGDGLNVYRSHFTQSLVDCSYTATTQSDENECDGNATPTETVTTPNGNTLGGGPEKGGDMGGVIIGWDYATVTTAKETTGACSGTTKVSHTAGRYFGFSGVNKENTIATAAKTFLPTDPDVYINGSAVTVSTCIAATDVTLYVSGYTGTIGTGQAFSAYIAPVANGEAGDNGNIGLKQ
jgi:ABC-type phosphate transport system substrate-binding protein